MRDGWGGSVLAQDDLWEVAWCRSPVCPGAGAGAHGRVLMLGGHSHSAQTRAQQPELQPHAVPWTWSLLNQF